MTSLLCVAIPLMTSDFVDVAQHLVESGVAQEGRLSCEGRSAGGLLMGAVLNMAATASPDSDDPVHGDAKGEVLFVLHLGQRTFRNSLRARRWGLGGEVGCACVFVCVVWGFVKPTYTTILILRFNFRT